MLLPPLQNALLFTVHTVFNLYISIVLFRIILQLVRANLHNPLTRFIVRVASFLPIPAIGQIIILQAMELILHLVIKGFGIPSDPQAIAGLLLWTGAELLHLSLLIMFWCVLLNAILSWVAPQQHSPAQRLLEQISDYLLRPIRKLLPNSSMLDFSPLVFIFLCTIAGMLITDPLISLGMSLL